MSEGERDLTVAVTGPTGTFGFGLMPLLQADDRVARVVGIARRPFDPAAHGWTKMEYRRGDLTAADVAREFGMLPLPLPAGPAQSAARAVAALPFLPPAAQWVEAASHPAIMDTTRARKELGWTPRFTALEALRDTVRRGPAGS